MPKMLPRCTCKLTASTARTPLCAPAGVTDSDLTCNSGGVVLFMA